MRLLLDTHVVLWWLADAAELSREAHAAIAAPDNLVHVSAISLWEIVLKRSLGKLSMPDDWAQALERESFRRLPVTWEHALKVGALPDLHRDPFDRLLLAQALAENLTLVTSDDTLLRYNVPILRA
jgi:PIN domain nuclease of toxin-antitoxin system